MKSANQKFKTFFKNGAQTFCSKQCTQASLKFYF